MQIQAAVLNDFRRPLIWTTIEIADPQADECVLTVRAAGICGRDRVVARGGFPNYRPPLVLGHEIFGAVEGRPCSVYPFLYCGECPECRIGQENLCTGGGAIFGETRPGGYATAVVVPKTLLIPLPDDAYVRYAAATCPVATSLHAVRVSGIHPGDRALVTGAGGGVGIHMVQVLRQLGVDVIALTTPHKAGTLRSLGVQVLTEQKRIDPVDVVFENVGTPTMNYSLSVLRRQGTLVWIGNVTGTAPRIARPALTIMREHRIVGSAAYTRREWMQALEWIASGRVQPFYRTFALSDVNAAYQAMDGGEVIGRAVLIPEPDET